MLATELAPTYRSNPNGHDNDVACALDSQSMVALGHTGIVRDGRPRFARPQHRPFDTTLPDLHPGSWEELQAKSVGGHWATFATHRALGDRNASRKSERPRSGRKGDLFPCATTLECEFHGD